jgi:hypothetical protein
MAPQGSLRLAVLLCKFRDTEQIEPNPASFYNDLFIRRDTGGLNDYWIAASLGAIDLDRSQLFGWKTLDVDRADYLVSNPGRWDRIEGAIEAFGITPSEFDGVVAVFNEDVMDGGAAGTGVLVGPQNVNVTFLAHETGHVFGLEHSFDHSSRKALLRSSEGECFDRQDIMSAMNVDGDVGHRFSPRGPLLNVPNLDRMGWLSADRIWRPMDDSSRSYGVDLVALEHPEIDGFLAVRVGGLVAEFRMADGFDAGMARPAVLFHNESATPNSYIIASDAENNVHEWQPGQVHGNPVIFDLLGGARVTVVSFDLQRMTARLLVQVKARTRPSAGTDSSARRGTGRLSSPSSVLVLENGESVPMPPPEARPESAANGVRAMVRAQVLEVLKEELGIDVRPGDPDRPRPAFHRDSPAPVVGAWRS